MAEVIVGLNEWLFLTGDSSRSIEQYQGRLRFDDSQLKDHLAVYQATADGIAKRGSAFLLVIVPGKENVYSSFLPPEIKIDVPQRPRQQLTQRLAQVGSVPFLDVTDTLLAEKTTFTFYKNDTHWNDHGAYLGYRAIMERLATQLPAYASALSPMPLERFELKEELFDKADLAYMLNENPPRSENTVRYHLKGDEIFRHSAPPDVLDLGPRPLIMTEVDNTDLPTAVIFRDSFSTRLIPFLARHFRTAYFVWNENPNLFLVDQVKPDAVLQIKAERFLLKSTKLVDTNEKFTWHDGVWRKLTVCNHTSNDIMFRSIQHRTEDGDPRLSSERVAAAGASMSYDFQYLGKFTVIVSANGWEKFRLVYRVEPGDTSYSIDVHERDFIFKTSSKARS